MDDFAILYLKIESSYTNISQPVRVSADRKMSNISNNTKKKGRKKVGAAELRGVIGALVHFLGALLF